MTGIKTDANPLLIFHRRYYPGDVFKAKADIIALTGCIFDNSGNRSAEAWQVDVVESVLSVSSLPILSKQESVSATSEKSKAGASASHKAQLALFE